MLKISINGPHECPRDGIFCVIDLWRIGNGREPFQATYLAKTDDVGAALMRAIDLVKEHKLDQ